jgi:hypothetical protein
MHEPTAIEEHRQCGCGCGEMFAVRRGPGRPREHLDGHGPHRAHVSTGNCRARPRHGELAPAPPELEGVDWHVTEGRDPEEEDREPEKLRNALLRERVGPFKKGLKDATSQRARRRAPYLIQRNRPYVICTPDFTDQNTEDCLFSCLIYWAWRRAIGYVREADEYTNRSFLPRPLGSESLRELYVFLDRISAPVRISPPSSREQFFLRRR